MVLRLDMLQTLTLAIVIYYLGDWVRTKVKVLEEFCIPAPVIGGIIFAIVNLFLNQSNLLLIELDTTLQTPFMLVFFTTIGLSANLKLLKKGGLQIITFFLVSVMLVISQDAIGVLIAKVLGQNPLLGLLGGSVTMVGGHATGVAFGQLFESNYGFPGATTVAMAAATFGLITGSLIGGPVGRRLVEKNNLASIAPSDMEAIATDKEEVNFREIFRMFAIIMISISIGSILFGFFEDIGFTIPPYVTTMIIAAIILNVGEKSGKLKINNEATDILGNLGLNIFLSMALINLRLWELKDVFGPILVILVAQTIIMIFFAYFVAFRFCGRDYDAAVLSSGFCGFGMGATPNAMANMSAMTRRYGHAPRAFLVLPIVGAFFIDFTNSIVITVFLNMLK